MSLTQEQRAALLAQGEELNTWIKGYRRKIDRILANPGQLPNTEALHLMDLALAKSRTLNSIRWCLFCDQHPENTAGYDLF